MLGTVALSGVVSIFFAIIVTIYLLLDGKRIYAWLIAYVPRVHRESMAITVSEVSVVVCAYVRGQHHLAAVHRVRRARAVFAARAGRVAARVLAGFCDVIPVIGVVLATAPAVLLALTVSPAKAGSWSPVTSPITCSRPT